MKIVIADLPNDAEQLRIVADKAFQSTPDSSIDTWFSFVEMEDLIKRERGICLKAVTESGGIIGMIVAHQESPINGKESEEKWVISLEAVLPENSGQGVGSALLTELEAKVRSKGATKLFTYTNKDDEKVINFYKNNGFEDAGWIRDYQYGQGNSAVFLLKYL